MRAARSLPMPGISRSPVSSSAARSCGWFDAMSAPLRYARILKGFSSLISSRSAISRRTRAMAALSNPEPFGFDAVVEQPRAAGGERLRNRRLRARDQRVDRRRRDAGCEPLPVVPLDGNLPPDPIPVAALERRAHRRRGVADPLEAVEDVAIAVGVALGDLPVVRAGMAR